MLVLVQVRHSLDLDSGLVVVRRWRRTGGVDVGSVRLQLDIRKSLEEDLRCDWEDGCMRMEASALK
jgi:hypothetical protein